MVRASSKLVSYHRVWEMRFYQFVRYTSVYDRADENADSVLCGN